MRFAKTLSFAVKKDNENETKYLALGVETRCVLKCVLETTFFCRCIDSRRVIHPQPDVAGNFLYYAGRRSTLDE
jgi:hypothetical protein